MNDTVSVKHSSTLNKKYCQKSTGLEIVFHMYLQGTLKGFDQTINLILDDSFERVFSSGQGVEQVVLGLYIVRGDNV